MTVKIRQVLLIFSSIALFSTLAGAQSGPPAIFFSDLQSGPKTGGQNNNGAFVTIYGNNFGTARGTSTVTAGSGQVASYVIWGQTYLWYQKIVIQLGPNATSGNIVVHTSAGDSNGIAFTVRSGNIYFVATTGSDTNSGSFTNPWSTITHARSAMVAGDITYARNGVVAGTDDGYGSPLNISGVNGTAANPFALVVYPGESAAIGSSANQRGIIQYPTTSNYWMIAGFTLTLTASSEAIHLYQGTSNWRLVGNSISCPNGDGSTGCVTTDGAPFTDFLGNVIHDTGAVNAIKTYHAFYFGDHGTTGNQSINVGWNSIYNIHGCRGILFHSIDSTPGAEGYNLTIHDNLIHDTQCDGIALANVNADKGPIKVFNNVLYHVGTGPDPQGNSANYSCFYVGDGNGKPSTPVDFYNNTCYDGGSRGAAQGDAGAYTIYIPTRLRNNITYELSGEAYFTTSTLKGCAATCITGSNNLWFGAGSAPSQTTGNVTSDPLFVNAAGKDFHLQSGSPAKDSGVAISGLLTDFDGVIRPQGAALDLGAYEFFQGSGAPPPSCDLNGDGVVNNMDVQIAIDQALGVATCGSADLQQTGRCDVVDVQRVINTSLGQACRVGP